MGGERTAPGEDRDRYLRCKRLLFREGRAEEEPERVCAGFCRTPIGPISVLDCPEWRGHSCRFFEEREGDPEPLPEGEIAEAHEALQADYLRWRYWKRTRDLRAPPEVVVHPAFTGEAHAPPVHEIPARPEAVMAAAARRKPRFPGDAPSGPPPRPVEEVDLDHLPDLLPEALPEEPDEAMPEPPAEEPPP